MYNTFCKKSVYSLHFAEIPDRYLNSILNTNNNNGVFLYSTCDHHIATSIHVYLDGDWQTWVNVFVTGRWCRAAIRTPNPLIESQVIEPLYHGTSSSVRYISIVLSFGN